VKLGGVAVLTSSEVSRALLDLRTAYVGLMASSYMAVMPTLPLLNAFRLAFPTSAPVIELPDTDGSKETFHLEEVLREISGWGFGAMDKHVMPSAQIVTAISAGDLVMQNNLHDPKNPALQFLRHYRNGCAHGDTWSFSRDALKESAVFMDMNLNYPMNGTRTTSFVRPVRHVQLLKDLSDLFGPAAAPDKTDSWRPAPGS
jgi:hypothetical protein